MNKNKKKMTLHRGQSGHKQKRARALMAETKEDLWNNKAMKKNVSIFFLCCGQGDLPPLKKTRRAGGGGENITTRSCKQQKTGQSAHASHAWSRPALRENGGRKKQTLGKGQREDKLKMRENTASRAEKEVEKQKFKKKK